MSSVTQAIVNFAAIGFVAGFSWFVWTLLRTDDDRPLIRVKNGSLKFIIDPPASGQAAIKWARRMGPSDRAPFRAHGVRAKRVVSFKVEMKRANGTTACSGAAASGVFDYQEVGVGGARRQVVVTIDRDGSADFDVPCDDATITINSPRELVVDGKTKRYELISATFGGTVCQFGPDSDHFVVYSVH